MSIADQITRLNNAKAAIKQSLENKGVTVSDSALLDEYPALINSIPLEGGDPYYEEFYNLRTNNGTNMTSMFARTSGELDLRRVDVSNVTNMMYMFDYSTASVNIDGWDTSNVTDMERMFYTFTGSIDISKLNTSNVTNVRYMFGYADTDKIILTGLSFPKCTSLDSMFNYATGTTLDLSSWDISNITNMNYMFSDTKYTRIDLTGWNTSKVTNMARMFYTYSNPLVELIIPNWDMSNYSGNIFYSSSYISKLMLIDLSQSNDATITKIASYLPTRTTTTFGKVLVPYDTSQTTYDALVAKYWAPLGASMSPNLTSCVIISDLDEIYPSKKTKIYLGAYEPWNGDTTKVEIVALDESIATIDEDNIVTSTGVLGDIVLEARIKDTQEVVGTKTIVVTETDSYPNLVKWRAASTQNTYSAVITVNGSAKKLSDLTYDPITDIYSYDSGAPITKIIFESASYLSELVKLDTSNMTIMDSMFHSCSQLTQLDASNWDSSNVTDTSHMFYNCKLLTSVDLSNFDMTNVTDTNYMFNGCTSLQELRLDNCSKDTISKIINSYGFPVNNNGTIYCKKENAAGLSAPTNWVFSFITEEPSIPLYDPGEFTCTELFEIRTMVNESHTDLGNMFQGCYVLASVNTQDWDTSNVTNMGSMFDGCSSLKSLDLSSFDTSNVTNMSCMFAFCEQLESLDLSIFDMTNVTDTSCMFFECNALRELHLDYCSKDTISKIINSEEFPVSSNGTIYCKEENVPDTLPEDWNWTFSYID